MVVLLCVLRVNTYQFIYIHYILCLESMIKKGRGHTPSMWNTNHTFGKSSSFKNINIQKEVQVKCDCLKQLRSPWVKVQQKSSTDRQTWLDWLLSWWWFRYNILYLLYRNKYMNAYIIYSNIFIKTAGDPPSTRVKIQG